MNKEMDDDIAFITDYYDDSFESLALSTCDLCYRMASEWDLDYVLSKLPKKLNDLLSQEVREIPASADDFMYIQSSNYCASFFEGLTDEEIELKIEEDRRNTKIRIFNGMIKLHDYYHNNKT